MMRISFIIFLLIYFLKAIAQYSFERRIFWESEKKVVVNNTQVSIPYFQGAFYPKGDFLPYYSENFNISNKDLKVEITNQKWEVRNYSFCNEVMNMIPKSFTYSWNILFTNKRTTYNVEICPLINENGKIKILSEFTITFIPAHSDFKKIKRSYVQNSILANGKWKKIRINNSGVYKITYDQLVSMGFTNLNNIKIYGNGGNQLPFNNAGNWIDDLQEIPIYYEKGVDNIFNSGDYIFCFLSGTTKWYYDNQKGMFLHKLHNYSDYAYYFITDYGDTPKQIEEIDENNLTPNIYVNEYDNYGFYEKEHINLSKGGRLFFSESFEYELTKTYSFYFNKVKPLSELKFLIRAGASSTTQNTLSVYVNNNFIDNISFPGIGSSINQNYAILNTLQKTITNSSNVVTFKLTYNKPVVGGVAYLDFIVVNVKELLEFTNKQFIFRNINTCGNGNITKFFISTTKTNTRILDVTNFFNPLLIVYNNEGTGISYIAKTDTLREFVIFDETTMFVPEIVGDVPNQNLHALSNIDMVIVTLPELTPVANEIAKIHNEKDNLNVVVLTPDKIYNEFSSGIPDITAIRFFMKMLYDKASDSTTSPKYLLLLGDGSYDNKRLMNNIIPTYQANNSSPDALSGFTTDDYYGMLDDNEYEYFGTLEVGVGRIPVNNINEAHIILNKIKNYYSTNSLGDWKNVITFIADDEDGNEYVVESEYLSSYLDSVWKNFNTEKIYLDAYKQISTPTGNRYPDAHDAIKNKVEKGSFIINYIGHGNEYGLTHEHVIIVSDILNWKNYNKLFFFITATCEFSRWDDHERTSAGEYAFINPNGGAIVEYSTTRAVFANSNFALNKQIFYAMLKPESIKKRLKVGDIYRISKNNTGGPADINKRNFTLIGDPALALDFPDYIITIDSINHKPVDVFSDTIRPLSIVTISGKIKDNESICSNFNGTLYITVYDKPNSTSTLANDGGTPVFFKIQNNILFKGKATVKNGLFKFSFPIPKYINYSEGYGKISLYAEDKTNNKDAAGNYSKLILGGDYFNVSDNKGPDINLYINDEKFTDGSICNENPTLIVLLQDESGINITSNSIGNGIFAYLDNSNNKIKLNDYFSAEIDNYQKGKVEYKFENLSEGKHTITVEASDILNNKSIKQISFTVYKEKELVIDRVYNYPNPFTTKTRFFFEHNQLNNNVLVHLEILTMTGKVIKTIIEEFYSDSFRSNFIEWDGTDTYGDRVGNGVYFYRLRVITNNGSCVKYGKVVKI
ncbi:MAG: type IX secretion system sortase PorU [Bacteroidales bacterium]|nr:type IX secretion system sortase PorU [Bacteroidales bacterium]